MSPIKGSPNIPPEPNWTAIDAKDARNGKRAQALRLARDVVYAERRGQYTLAQELADELERLTGNKSNAMYYVVDARETCPWNECGHGHSRHGATGCLEEDCYCKAPGR